MYKRPPDCHAVFSRGNWDCCSALGALWTQAGGSAIWGWCPQGGAEGCRGAQPRHGRAEVWPHDLRPAEAGDRVVPALTPRACHSAGLAAQPGTQQQPVDNEQRPVPGEIRATNQRPKKTRRKRPLGVQVGSGGWRWWWQDGGPLPRNLVSQLCFGFL